MKKSGIITALTAMAVLSSCSNNDAPGMREENSTLRVSASIDQTKTRASGTEWADGDLIGVTGGDFVNIPYVASESGRFSAQGENIFLSGNDEITFSAYYPYTNEYTDESTEGIAFNVADESGIYTATPENIDFMFAPGVNASVANPDVNFLFSHSMAKLMFTVNDGTNTLSPEDCTATLKLDNIATKGTFDVTTGVVTADATLGTLSSSIRLGEATSLIVPSFPEGSLPETMKLTIQVVNNGKTSNYSVAIAPALNAGTQYNYTLTLQYGKDLNVSSPTITDWNQEDNNGELISGDVKIANIGDYLLKDGSILKASALTDENKANIAGVVYFVGNPQPSVLYTDVAASADLLRSGYAKCFNGLAIALDNANDGASKFASTKIDGITTIEFPVNYTNLTFTFKNIQTTSSYILGFNNTAMFDYIQENSLLTTSFLLTDLLNDYNAKNAVTDASTWYLPSLPEFNRIKDNFSTIKTSIEAAGGNLARYPNYTNSGDAANYRESFYWTSNMRNGTSPFVSSLADTADAASGEFQNGSGGNNIGWFRFAIAF